MNFLQCLFWAPLKWNMKWDTYEAILQNFLFWNNNRLTGSCTESRQVIAYCPARLPQWIHLGNIVDNVNTRELTWVQLLSLLAILLLLLQKPPPQGQIQATPSPQGSPLQLRSPSPTTFPPLAAASLFPLSIILSYGTWPFETGFVYSAKCPWGPSKLLSISIIHLGSFICLFL